MGQFRTKPVHLTPPFWIKIFVIKKTDVPKNNSYVSDHIHRREKKKRTNNKTLIIDI